MSAHRATPQSTPSQNPAPSPRNAAPTGEGSPLDELRGEAAIQDLDGLFRTAYDEASGAPGASGTDGQSTDAGATPRGEPADLTWAKRKGITKGKLTDIIFHETERALEEGAVSEVRECLSALGIFVVPKRVWMEAGERALAQGRLGVAMKLFAEGNDLGRVLDVGTRAIDAKQYDVAEQAYELADVAFPTEVYVAAGDDALAAGNLRDAVHFFGKAGEREKLARVGDEALRTGDAELACRAFRGAGASVKLVAAAEQLSATADQALAQGLVVEALGMYNVAGGHQKLVRVGDHAVETQQYDVARAAYELASRVGSKVARERLRGVSSARVMHRINAAGGRMRSEMSGTLARLERERGARSSSSNGFGKIR